MCHARNFIRSSIACFEGRFRSIFTPVYRLVHVSKFLFWSEKLAKIIIIEKIWFHISGAALNSEGFDWANRDFDDNRGWPVIHSYLLDDGLFPIELGRKYTLSISFKISNFENFTRNNTILYTSQTVHLSGQYTSTITWMENLSWAVGWGKITVAPLRGKTRQKTSFPQQS